MFLADMGFVLQ